ncbi:MAG: hypothetical protein IBX69_16700 [Anaerolineales bacterium]|nr:hypothetical protein [Anaerolineales bacterium]
MKTKGRIINILIVLSLVVAMLPTPAQEAFAQDDDGQSAWGEFLNPDGSINWNNLTYLGEVSEPVDWMNIDIPGGIQIPLGKARYNRYITPSGNVLVLPSPATMFMSFLKPGESGLEANPPHMLSNGHSILSMLATDYIDFDQLQELGYVSPAEFFQAVIDGQVNIWSVVSPNFLFEILQMTLDAGYLVTTLWLYLHGEECATIPGGCPPGIDDPENPQIPPPPTACPQPSLTSDPVHASGEKVAPLNPIVIGQDPERRGVDLNIQVSIPPVIFTWHETITTYTCRYEAGGEGEGCPGPGYRYQQVIGEDGSPTTWDSSMEDNGNWQVITNVDCIRHVEVFTDYLAYAYLRVNLSPESRQWILTHLAKAYPGARLKRPDWQFTFQGPGSLDGGGAVSWSQLIPRIQFSDPGQYTMRLVGLTTGTTVSTPRSFDLPLNPFSVDMLRVTLVEAP